MRAPRALRLQDVAERAGVSLATASRALSGRDGVSSGVAERVREVARDMGYVANPHARSLAGGSTPSVGLVVHEISDPYFAEIATGVMRVGDREGLTVQVCHTGRDPDREVAQIRALTANRVGRIIIAGSGFVDAAVQRETRRALDDYRATGGRVAVIGRHHLSADAVLPDNRDGARSMVEHLLSLGHRRLAIVAGSRLLTTVADRLAGATETLTEHGLDPASMPVIEAEFTRRGGKEAARRVLDEHPDVTAILALNDDMAIGVLSALRGAGVDVPRDVSVAGFDDIGVAQDLAPSLTTVRLPMTSIGEIALSLTLQEPAARPRRRTTGHELVIRDSTGAPRP
ncbi:LacI family transcriptional regulator [Aeromicrobium camelliae]|uniref:LacI family transcriptional regulator n=1 Tax=Aeromicrobium camelliae TaxID=1538144 RepID=A0A3N6W667_9ACTN|nr:LacI family DNA-binding transcriptional regulator [Aeromicrobium camelliae]RQN03019.1 LacI family transcriptional regulator [Aeromicrobium camelliae]